MLDKPKHERCPECKLCLRCGDQERHEAGWHHNNRLATLKAQALKARKGG